MVLLRFLFITGLIIPVFCKGQHDDSLRLRHSVSIAPFATMIGTYTKVKVRYQFKARTLAAGLDAKYFFNKYYGFQISPFIKAFPFKKKLRNAYGYAAGHYGKNKHLPANKALYYNCYGFSGGLGVQPNIPGRENCFFDLNIGLKQLYTDSNIHDNGPGTVSSDYLDFFVLGPGAMLDATIALGFRF